jgi:hypothetical protein
MIVGRRSLALICAALWMVFAGSSAGAQSAGPAQDILCAHAPKGSVLPVPALVADWVTVICVPTGQALAPEIKKYKSIWISTANGQPFLLTAAPLGWTKPDKLSAYEIRFSALAANELGGAAKAHALDVWDQAFKTTPRPAFDRVVQLDARSVVQGQEYNLLFYTIGDEPRSLLICRDHCATWVTLKVQDIKTGMLTSPK